MSVIEERLIFSYRLPFVVENSPAGFQPTILHVNGTLADRASGSLALFLYDTPKAV
jgi:hypothetical protein